MHLLDDAGDDDGLALIVIESLADEMLLLLGEHRFGERARHQCRARETLHVLLRRNSTSVASKFLPSASFTPSAFTRVFVGVVVGHRRFLALLVGQRIELRRTAAARQAESGVVGAASMTPGISRSIAMSSRTIAKKS